MGKGRVGERGDWGWDGEGVGGGEEGMRRGKGKGGGRRRRGKGGKGGRRKQENGEKDTGVRRRW